MMRKALHTIHLWLGLIFCVPLVLLGLTGSILVYQHELEDLAAPPMTIGVPHSTEEILAAAIAKAPEGFVPSMYRPAVHNRMASVFLTKQSRDKPKADEKASERMQMLVNPVSLDVTITPAGGSFMRQLLQFHSSLLLRDYGGRSIVGWFGVIMLAFGITGIVLWWPKPGQLANAFAVRPQSRGWQFHRELHGAAGIWSAFILIIVCGAGVYLAFPKTIDAAIGAIAPIRDLRAPPAADIKPRIGAKKMDVDAAIALAQQNVPDSRLDAVFLPAKLNQPYRIGLLRADANDGTPSVAVFIDPFEGRIIEMRDPKDYSTAETVIAWMHAVHSGAAFGWLYRVLVFMTGLLPLLFAFTGISMWLAKRRISK